MPAPHHLTFYRLDTLSDDQPTVSKHWRQCQCTAQQMQKHWGHFFRIESVDAVRLADWFPAWCQEQHHPATQKKQFAATTSHDQRLFNQKPANICHFHLTGKTTKHVSWLLLLISINLEYGRWAVSIKVAMLFPSGVRWWMKKGGQSVIFSRWGQCFEFPSLLWCWVTGRHSLHKNLCHLWHLFPKIPISLGQRSMRNQLTQIQLETTATQQQ